MITSGQIGMMMAQQNQGFAGTAAYAQQISSSMPGVYGGGTANMANAIGDRAMSAGFGAANFGLGLAGAVLPFSAGMNAFGAARFLGAGFGGAAAAGLGTAGAFMAPVAALSYGAKQVMAGAQQQAMVESSLGGFHFQPGGGASQGFSRQQAMAVGDMMRKMSVLPEMMTSMNELTRIMDKMGHMGMMHGTQSVTEFQNKFKENIKVLKSMATMMGSTMEEALPLFGELRRTGFYTTGDILQNAMSRQITGGVTGMSQNQVAGLAAMGSQISFGTGGSRRSGAQLALRMANQLGAARSMGVLSDDQIAELTGLEGAAGIQAMSQQLTQASYRMMRGAPGTVMTLALGAQEGGRYTGEMDADLVARMKAGEFSTADLRRMARQRSRGRAAQMSYAARSGQMRSEMAGQLGVEGQFQMISNMLGERGFENPDAMRIVSQRFGLSEREADLMVDLGKRMPEIRMEMKIKSRLEAREQARRSIYNQKYSWDSIKDRIGRRVGSVLKDPFVQFGAEMRNAINRSVEDFVSDVTGQYTEQVSKGMSDLVQKAVLGSKAAQAQITQGLRMGSSYMSSLGSPGMGMDFSRGAFTRGLAGIDGTGETLMRAMAGTRLGATGYEWEVRDARKRGYHILGKSESNLIMPDEYMAVTNQDIETFRTNLSAYSQGTLSDEQDRILESRRLGGARAAFETVLGQFDTTLATSSFEDVEGLDRVDAVASALRARGPEYERVKRRLNINSDVQFISFLTKRAGRGDPLGIRGITSDVLGISRFAGMGPKQRADVRKKATSQLSDAIGADKAQQVLDLLDESGPGTAAALSVFAEGQNWEGLKVGIWGPQRDMRDPEILEKMWAVEKSGDFSFKSMGSLGYGTKGVRRFIEEMAIRSSKGQEISEASIEFLEMQGNAYPSAKQALILDRAMDKYIDSGGDAGALNDQESKALIAATGKDIKDKDTTLPWVKRLRTATNLLKKVGSRPGGKALATMFGLHFYAGGETIAERYRDMGHSQSRDLTSLSKMEGFRTGPAADIISKLQERAERLKGTTVKDLEDAQGAIGGDLGEIAMQTSLLPDEQAVAISEAMGDEGLAPLRARGLRNMLFTKKGERRGRKFLTKEDLKEFDADMLKGIEFERGTTKRGKPIEGDKGLRVTEETLDTAMKQLALQTGIALPTGARVEKKSTQVSAETVAKSMEVFSKNVINLAEIVNTMKGE